MPKALAIVRPLPFNALGGTLGTVANLATANPKEISAPAAIGSTIDIDLGAATNIDTIFLGYSNIQPTGNAAALAASYGVAAYNTTNIAGGVPLAGSGLFSGRRHYFAMLAAPVNARYVRLTFQDAGVSAGIVAVGRSFQSALGHEYGAGRTPEDTSVVERLFGGGFGISEGAILSGYDWTFGDLTDAERDSLFALVMALGSSRSVLVIEDPDTVPANLNERIHWGLFDRLEKYERQSVGLTRWNFRIKDWG